MTTPTTTSNITNTPTSPSVAPTPPSPEVEHTPTSTPPHATSPTDSPILETFNSHLERLREIKSITNSVVTEAIPGSASATASLSMVWEMVFDFLCRVDSSLKLPQLHILANIIQKLMSAYNNIQSLEIKNSLQRMKTEEHEVKVQKMREALRTVKVNSDNTLSEETITALLSQLNLL